jgi:tRNA1(Val) A37 N6-methylase TrmN6
MGGASGHDAMMETTWEEKMDEEREYQIGSHRIVLHLRDDVGPVSLYSLSLAEHIPDLTGLSVVDVGSGSGFLAILASLQGAKRVYLLDSYDGAIALTLENAERNHVRDGLVHLPIGDAMIPLPPGERVDVILSNPAQLPLPKQEQENSPFYAGPDGRSMIDAIIREAPEKLSPRGLLMMTHNSLANLPKSLSLLRSVGLEPRVIAEQQIAFRPFINRPWLDTLGGSLAGLYTIQDEVAYESLYVLRAQMCEE